MINVTQTYLPPQEEYQSILKRAWDNKWLTNRGELACELEVKISNYLELDQAQILLTNNGTVPIQIALKLLAKHGEVITTPFSYVATTAAIVWEGCTPIFVDIHPEYLTIDESKIEAAITEKTTCILATHVFGNPCNIEAIEKIAKKHDLKVIYDAAHCFGVKYKEKSIFEYGDISTCSFHATKLFHTGEGGAIFCKDPELFHQIFYSHNFGHKGPTEFHGLGINGKTSELQAAMGLAVLPYMQQIIKDRKYIVDRYKSELNWDKLKPIMIRENSEWNYSYFPVILDSEITLLQLEKKLNDENIFPRRYFCPSLNRLKYVISPVMIHSEDVSSRVLCLPLYSGLTKIDLKLVTDTINKQLRK